VITRQKPAAAKAATKERTPNKRKRPQLGIIVSQETKDLIEQQARESNRSMGQVVEHLIQEALHTRQVLADVRSSIRKVEEVGTRAIATVLFHHMWTPLRTTKGGTVWAPPDTPLPVEIDTAYWAESKKR
jgi:hypothetical protein